MNIIVNEQANQYLLNHIDSGIKGNQKESNCAGFFFSEIEKAWISFDKDLNIGVHEQMPKLNELGR
jgi:hypothetical protein